MESVFVAIGAMACVGVVIFCTIGAIVSICNETEINKLKERIRALETKE